MSEQETRALSVEEALERIAGLHHDSLHSRAVPFGDCDWHACTMARVALAERARLSEPAPLDVVLIERVLRGMDSDLLRADPDGYFMGWRSRTPGQIAEAIGERYAALQAEPKP